MSERLPGVVDEGPMARLGALKLDGGAPVEVFRLVSEGETLRGIAKRWRLPRGAFARWYMEEYREEYEAALRVRADELAHEAVSISDEQAEVVRENGQSFDPDVSRDRLRVDTRLKVASKWDRARYGESVKVESGGRVPVDDVLLGTIGELLRLAARPRLGAERVVEGEAEVVSSVPATGTGLI